MRRSRLTAVLGWVAVLLVISPTADAGTGWQRYVSTDGGFSFHHPQGWTTRQTSNLVQVSNPPADEELLVARIAGQGRASPAQFADRMVAHFRTSELPDYRVTSRKKLEGGVLLELAFTSKSVGYRSMAMAAVSGADGWWIAFSAPEARYDADRASRIVLGALGSLSGGDRSRPPDLELKPAPPAAGVARPASSAQAEPARAGFEEPKEFFRPPGRQLVGYYGGAFFREQIRTHLTTGTPGTTGSGNVSAWSGGGDFRLALYADGTVRAEFDCLDYTIWSSRNVDFRYEGRYELKGDTFRTGELKLVHAPKTVMKHERGLAALRIWGRLERAEGRLHLTRVETRDAQGGEWRQFREDVTLARPLKRTGGASATYQGTGSRTTAGSKD